MTTVSVGNRPWLTVQVEVSDSQRLKATDVALPAQLARNHGWEGAKMLAVNHC